VFAALVIWLVVPAVRVLEAALVVAALEDGSARPPRWLVCRLLNCTLRKNYHVAA
jgi:hypothetical protein